MDTLKQLGILSTLEMLGLRSRSITGRKMRCWIYNYSSTSYRLFLALLAPIKLSSTAALTLRISSEASISVLVG